MKVVASTVSSNVISSRPMFISRSKDTNMGAVMSGVKFVTLLADTVGISTTGLLAASETNAEVMERNVELAAVASSVKNLMAFRSSLVN